LKVTILRPFNGIGDWLFALGCIKYVNRQRPDVEIHCAFHKARQLPTIVPELFRLSDARYSEGFPDDSTPTHDSLVYRKRPPELFLESTLQHLNDQTGLGVRYEHGVYPSFNAVPESRGHIAMIGHGKKRIRAGKEWGFENFSELACLLLDSGYEVVQIGADNDWRLPRASSHVMGASADKVLSALVGARLFIGIENGMMVLAGYLGIPQITIYDGNGYPTRVDFDKQLKLTGKTDPDEVMEVVRAC
jgi:ADP-heptose:LPS heptosyltransferase